MREKPLKEEVWIQAAIAVAGASNTIREETVVRWADFIAGAYEKRFIEGDK